MLNDLKAKLPFLKKKNAERDESEDIEEDDKTDQTDLTDVDLSDDEEERVDENSSFVDKLKSKFKKKNAKSSDDDEDEKKTPADNKRRTIIIGVIVLGLVVLLFGDQIIPTEEPVPEVASSFKKPNRKKPTPAADATGTETATDPSVATTDTTETNTTVGEAPTTEVPDSTFPDQTVDPTATIETTPDSSVDVTSTDSSVDLGEPDVTSTFPVEEPTDTSITDIPPTSIDSVDGEITSGNDDNLTDQILQDLEKQAKTTQKPSVKTEYVAPPDYEYRGRGLVYNCRGKHWACVDAPSFKTCEDNASSTKYLKKSQECYPFNIYESQKGCENIQNRMVSSSAKTEFCSE